MQREHTENVLAVCTLCFYISKTQISTTLHSYLDNHMMKKVLMHNEVMIFAATVFASFQRSMAWTLSLLTTMCWSSNKQTHKNIQVKRNLDLLMVRRAHWNLKTEWIIYKPGFEKPKITFSIIATITKAVKSINYKSARRWACKMAKSNHQQQYTNKPCVVPWSCSDKTPKKPGEADLELHISNNMKTYWKQGSSFPSHECRASFCHCQDFKAWRKNTLHGTYSRSNCSSLLRAVNSKNWCIWLGTQ